MKVNVKFELLSLADCIVKLIPVPRRLFQCLIPMLIKHFLFKAK